MSDKPKKKKAAAKKAPVKKAAATPAPPPPPPKAATVEDARAALRSAKTDGELAEARRAVRSFAKP